MTTLLQANMKKRSWIITTVLAAVALAYAFLVFLPGQKAIGKLRLELQEKQQFIAQSQMVAASVEDTKKRLDDTRQFAKDWQESAPGESELSLLFGQIADAAKQSSVRTVRFDPQPVKKMDTIWKISVALGVEGSFSQVMELFRRIETLPVTIWVEDVQMEATEKDTKDVRCELNLVIFADNPDNSG